MGLLNRFAAAGVITAVVVSSCGARPEPVSEPVRAPVETFLATTSTTTITPTTAATTTEPPSETAAIELPDVGVRIGAMPRDFQPHREPGVIQATDEIDHSYQVFLTPTNGGTVTVGVTRGALPEETAENLSLFRPGAVATEMEIRGRTVYRLAPDRELTDEEAIFLNITEFFWYHDDQTLVAVAGQGYDDEEVLLAIARSIEVLR